MKYVYHFDSLIGRLFLIEDNGQITNLYFENDPFVSSNEFLGVYRFEATQLLLKAEQQLCEYFTGERKIFDLPMKPAGTDFMMAVWSEVAKIPYGETSSYGEIAIKIGNPKASRTVGLANNRNPLPIFYPCHRVLGCNGKLVGYRGGVEVKKLLLDLESKHK